MRDLSYNESEKSTFILSYKIKDFEIIISLANGDKYVIPYTEENERKVIEKMEIQASNIRLKKISTFDLSLILIQPFAVYCAIYNSKVRDGVLFDYILPAIVFCTAFEKARFLIKKLKDSSYLSKIRFYLSNKEVLNKYLLTNSSNMLIGINKKVKKRINYNLGNGKAPLNINELDYYSLETLKTLLNNKERMEVFEFEEVEQLAAQVTDGQFDIEDSVPEKEEPKMLRLQ